MSLNLKSRWWLRFRGVWPVRRIPDSASVKSGRVSLSLRAGSCACTFKLRVPSFDRVSDVILSLSVLYSVWSSAPRFTTLICQLGYNAKLASVSGLQCNSSLEETICGLNSDFPSSNAI